MEVMDSWPALFQMVKINKKVANWENDICLASFDTPPWISTDATLAFKIFESIRKHKKTEREKNWEETDKREKC